MFAVGSNACNSLTIIDRIDANECSNLFSFHSCVNNLEILYKLKLAKSANLHHDSFNVNRLFLTLQ